MSWTTSGDGAHALTATAFDTTGLSASDTRTVAVDNTPPTVTVTSPAGGTRLGNDLADRRQLRPEGSGVASVQFLVDGNVVATDTSAPYSTSWNTATTTNGAHTITVRATDGAGNTATSTAVPVTVNNVDPHRPDDHHPAHRQWRGRLVLVDLMGRP